MNKILVLTVVLAALASSAFASRAIQNFKCTSDVSDQVRMEFDASNVYLSLATYFGQDQVALLGFSKMFEHSAQEEREHAKKFIDYSTKRGHRIVTPAISVSLHRIYISIFNL